MQHVIYYNTMVPNRFGLWHLKMMLLGQRWKNCPVLYSKQRQFEKSQEELIEFEKQNCVVLFLGIFSSCHLATLADVFIAHRLGTTQQTNVAGLTFPGGEAAVEAELNSLLSLTTAAAPAIWLSVWIKPQIKLIAPSIQITNAVVISE